MIIFVGSFHGMPEFGWFSGGGQDPVFLFWFPHFGRETVGKAHRVVWWDGPRSAGPFCDNGQDETDPKLVSSKTSCYGPHFGKGWAGEFSNLSESHRHKDDIELVPLRYELPSRCSCDTFVFSKDFESVSDASPTGRDELPDSRG